MVNRPTSSRLALRRELVRLRIAAKLRQADVATTLYWSTSKMARIESGEVAVTVTDLKALLGVYKADPVTVERLVALAVGSRERRWWTSYRDVLTPEQQQYMGFEADAVHLHLFEANVIPDLLQTREYMRAVIPAMSWVPMDPPHLDRLVEVRCRRQREIITGSSAQVEVVLDEAALHRQVGGPTVWREQLHRLADAARQGLVRLGVVPFTTSTHIGLRGPMHIMEFGGGAAVAYVRDTNQAMDVRDTPDQVARYSRNFVTLSTAASHGNDALDLVDKAAA
jgi:transcriptional regulator with XRE-family HTH domain